MAQPIEPLRVQKGTSTTSPSKMAGRALAELSPMERRRNSPSFNQNTKKLLLDSSPLETSPFSAKFNTSLSTASPRAYWQSREPHSPTRSAENRDVKDGSPSATKRSSIENLKRASRVKNSTMFAREAKQEYDPAAPVVERPLAAGRPLNAQSPTTKSEASPTKPSPISAFTETSLKHGTFEALKPGEVSPGKSSLSKNSRYGRTFDPENGIWSEDDDSFSDRQLPPGKSLHRHAKSVTFDVAPPQINEYEMTTPDPSSVASGSREGSYDSVEDDEEDQSFERDYYTADRGDDSFDASLEDTEKTPVVLPEDWRFMSPETANNDLTVRMDDVFDDRKGSPPVNAAPLTDGVRSSPTRTDSVNSNGERRPLPPLPPGGISSSPRRDSETSNALYAAAERLAASQRNLPTPPRPASVTKSELQSICSSSMPLEDRLRLMMSSDNDKESSAKSLAEEQRERRLRRGTNTERSPEKQGTEDVKLPPRISRESILRKVESKTMKNYDFDPDTPLPSMGERPVSEGSSNIYIKEEDDGEIDLDAIPEMAHSPQSSLQTSINGLDLGPSESDQEPATDDDGESHYSNDSKDLPMCQEESHALRENEPSTPRAAPVTPGNENGDLRSKHRLSFPQFSSVLGDEDFGLSFSNYMTPMSSLNEPTKQVAMQMETGTPKTVPDRPQTPLALKSLYDGSGYGNDDDYEEPGTPESVIRHSISPISEPEPEPEPIPEPVATIKAPGGKLKTRASLAPADIRTMAETRRQVSGESNRIPPIPEKAHNRPSVIPEADSFMPETSFGEEEAIENGQSAKRRSSLVPLDVSMEEVDEGLSMGLDKEFDRLIEAKKKGYLMRQNTKVVVASSASQESASTADGQDPQQRATKSAGNSPVKRNTSNTWTTEPWNGKVRRRSIRQSVGSPMKQAGSGAVPPLPGMASNVTGGLDSVAENEPVPEVEIDEFDQNGERGRLFVKVVGVKDLEMPLPRNERSYFALTLDNGLHCVQTSWLELGKNAPIGQEFELVVLNDLEFQLTLNTKIEPPKPAKETESPKKNKASAFSRVFTSPKKRKEMEMKEKEEAQKAAKQREIEARERRMNPSAWDLLHNLIASDGSFARSYISLKEHEEQAFGRPYTVDVPCFNEWTIDEARSLSSARNARTTAPLPPQRKAPYKIGKLELQLLYVPKPKEATDEDMPKSMNGCVRELAEAEKSRKVAFEGHLSQQGGDCPYWRRRLFKLDGPKLTAYHESTHQPRATINLAKAIKLIDDKSSLMAKEVSGKGGSRRKSAFAEEEEGYMFVEEGFRVRFANGEVIDFYADSTGEKENWMKVLSEVVGKDQKNTKSWTDLVLKKEKLLASRAPKTGPNSVGMKSAPNTPAKSTGTKGRPSLSRPTSHQQPPRPSSQQALARPSSQQATARPSSQQAVRPNADKPLPPTGVRDPRQMSSADRRQKTRSMIF